MTTPVAPPPSYTPTTYGQIVTGEVVRKAMESTIRLWFPSYLAEAGRQNGRAGTSLPNFKSYAISRTDASDRWPEDQIPTCVIVAPGLGGKPERRGDGFRVTWTVGVGVVVSARTRDETQVLVELYTAAVRALVIQKRSLGGVALATDWLDEQYDVLDESASRTVQAGSIMFGVDMEKVVDFRGGPTTPDYPYDPPGVPSEIETIYIDLQKES